MTLTIMKMKLRTKIYEYDFTIQVRMSLTTHSGEEKNNFADQNFSMTLFLGIFTEKIFDDLFLITKSSLMTPLFLLSSYFRTHPTTLLLKISSNFGEPSPQSSLSLRP